MNSDQKERSLTCEEIEGQNRQTEDQQASVCGGNRCYRSKTVAKVAQK